MIELWLAIIVLTLLALGFICWPLIKQASANTNQSMTDRQQENISMFEYRLAELQQELDQGLLTDQSFNELKFELEKNLLSDATKEDDKLIRAAGLQKYQVITVVLLCLSVPMVALAFYAKYGSSEDLLWSQNKTSSHQLPNGEAPSPEQAISLLEAELKRDPSNPEGWYMLAGVYMNTNQFAKGADAFAQVLETLPKTSPQFATVLGQYAQAIFFVEGIVSPKVKEQIEKALSIDANEVVSLGLLGIEAFEGQRYQEAIDFWNKSLVNADTNAAQALQSGIEKAKQELLAAGIAVIEEPKPQKSAHVSVDVDIAQQLKLQVDQNTTVFVFARPVGGRVPLAAAKLKVSDLPVRIVLDDTLAMMPTAKISMHEKVEVSARISLSGQPQSSAGDYQSQVLLLNVTQLPEPVQLLINKVVE
jgi:cytochrome c-type biogenesis protein CcmH